MAPFCSTVRARKVEPVSVPRFSISGSKLISACDPFQEGDVDDAAFGRQRVDVALDVVAAHHVENDIDAAGGRGVLDHLDEILVLVIDAARGAELLAGVAFVAAAGGGEDLVCAQRLGELDRRGADAAGAAMDQHRLAGAQIAALEQVGPHCEAGFRQRRRLGHAKALGHRQALRFGRHAIGGIAAAGDQRADRIANLGVMHAEPDRRHRAGDLEAGNVGRAGRRRILAHALHDIGPVDPGGGHFDQHLAGAGQRHRSAPGLQHIRPAGLGDFDRGYGGGKRGHG
jgi:hypothetical protein